MNFIQRTLVKLLTDATIKTVVATTQLEPRDAIGYAVQAVAERYSPIGMDIARSLVEIIVLEELDRGGNHLVIDKKIRQRIATTLFVEELTDQNTLLLLGKQLQRYPA